MLKVPKDEELAALLVIVAHLDQLKDQWNNPLFGPKSDAGIDIAQGKIFEEMLRIRTDDGCQKAFMAGLLRYADLTKELSRRPAQGKYMEMLKEWKR